MSGTSNEVYNSNQMNELLLPGGFALICLVGLFFAARYMAKTIAGKSYKFYHSLIIAVFGYLVVGFIAWLNLRGL